MWIESAERPSGWFEYKDAEKSGLMDYFESKCHTTHQVTLSHGKDYAFDEMYYFETAAGAEAFYREGYLRRESFPDGALEGCGFQEVTLYEGKAQIKTKASAPSPSPYQMVEPPQ